MKWSWMFLFLYFYVRTEARKHQLTLKDDGRDHFAVSTFGFYKKGYLAISLKNFTFTPFNESYVFGFTLDKTFSDAVSPYMENHRDRCILEDHEAVKTTDTSIAVIFFRFDLKEKVVKVQCPEQLQNITINTKVSYFDENANNEAKPQKSSKIADSRLFNKNNAHRKRRETLGNSGGQFSDSSLFGNRVRRDTTESNATSQNATAAYKDRCEDLHIPMEGDPINGYSTNIAVFMQTEKEEGLYNLYFHNCRNYQHPEKLTRVSLTMNITERNNGSYLSAGEMPLPALYLTMSLLFFLSGCFYVFILRQSNSGEVFKIHYLMVALVYLKSLSLFFHGINFHWIQEEGFHVEAWAVLYYITHLLKGALLFVTIILIGTGWAFVKSILSDKDKKIFIVVIPLQILANIALIIIEEGEEGEASYTTWHEVFILVDLLCCGAILLPVVGSIRHLQEASQTDGKAAISLRKLKLFRHFYIMIVCYIYFTRIIVYLLKITLPFQYGWLDEMFREMTTFVFFVLTGYKFRPGSQNPYLQIPQDEIEIDEVVTSSSGVTNTVTKVNRYKSKDSNDPEDKEALISKRESSHEYD